MFNKLKQIKDLRDKGKQIQAALEKETVQGSASWGKINITINGNQKVTEVKIDESLLNDKEKLENGIKDAFNDGMVKMQKLMASKMNDIGGLDLAKSLQEMIGKE
jgi:DNA-binding YbaB/EbfC family protein